MEAIQKSARIAGGMYLFLSLCAFLAEFYVRSKILVDDTAQTVSNILTFQQLFRMGIALDLIGAPGNVLLAIALYTILKSVDKSLALLAAFLRLGEAVILGLITFNSMVVLKLLSNADYSKGFDVNQIHSLTKLYFSAQGAGFNVSMVFFCLGSAIFCYLFYKSKYIPTLLAGWGIIGSLLALTGVFVVIILPDYQSIISPACYIPIGLFEITLGFWLLIKGVKIPNTKSHIDPD